MVLCEVRNAITPHIHSRSFWGWINIMFNKVDEQRRKEFGPDRTCAEWLLRNGGSVKWANTTEFLDDYNSLPIEGTRLHIQEVDASGSSIMHYGFSHFVGCNYIRKIVLHKCQYLLDPALAMLGPINGSLRHLEVSSCHNISEEGLRGLSGLSELRQLIIFDLPYVTDKDKVVGDLRKALPKCDVKFS